MGEGHFQITQNNFPKGAHENSIAATLNKGHYSKASHMHITNINFSDAM